MDTRPLRRIQSLAALQWALLMLLSLIPACGYAGDPRIGSFDPQGAQRGRDATIFINGPRIGKQPQELMLSKPGIEVRKLEAENNNRLKVELIIADDCPLGIHPVRVRTAAGLTNLMTLHIGALPEIREQEPNNDFALPQKLAYDDVGKGDDAAKGVVVNGMVKTEDVDYFAVELDKGERLSVEIEGLRLGRTFFDPAIAIFDAERFEVASCDDSALLQQDAYCTFVAPAAGKYVIAVRETAYRGNDACTYRLHVGRFPRPAAVFPPGGRPGEALEVRWIAGATGDWTESVTLPKEGDPDHRLFASDDGGVSPSGVPIRIVDIPNALEVEPNNGRPKATEFTAPAACSGIIDKAGDVDLFRFSAAKGAVYDVRAFARQLRSPLDPVMRIVNAEGKNVVANDDNAGKPDSYFRFKAPADGEYLLKVRDHLNAGGPDYVYRIEIAPPEPIVDLRVEEQRRYFATTADVPQGNHAALMMTATRRDMGGDLELLLENLPAGVTAEAIALPGNYNRIPVIFSAPADAPLGGTLAKLSTNNDKAADRFMQQTWLVRGQNNRPMWDYFDDSLPVAVTKPLPYRLKLIEPKAPLVKNGSMDLKVVAQRDEGFDAPIRVRTLYNPPGISSNRSRSIAKGKTEAVIPTTANGNARLGDWKIAVLGEANVDGRVIASTQFVTLKVAEPYVGLQFPTVATEQGRPVEYTVPVEIRTPFEGPARVTLMGLPAGVKPGAAEITNDSKQLTFALEVAADARIGRHKRVFCQVVVMENGEPVTHTIGYGELRIDPPAPVEQTVAQK